MNKYNDIRLIGLTGKAGSGKDTLADAISDRIGTRLAFANPLKDICIRYFGLTKEDAYTPEGKAKYNEFWGMTNREIIQKVGTDALRNGFHPDVWVKITEIEIRKRMEGDSSKPGLVVVTDCRFDNEAEMIERHGGIVMRVERPSSVGTLLTEKELSHKSEAGISEDYISAVIRNDRGISNLPAEFQGKKSIFESAHSRIADSLDAYVSAGALNCRFAERVLLFLKKHVYENCLAVFPAEDGSGKALRAEWSSPAEGNCVIAFAESENRPTEIGFKKFSGNGSVLSEGTVFGLTAENGKMIEGLVSF